MVEEAVVAVGIEMERGGKAGAPILSRIRGYLIVGSLDIFYRIIHFICVCLVAQCPVRVLD